MEEGRDQIRKWTWVVLIFNIIGLALIIGGAVYFKTIYSLVTNWFFYLSELIIILSLIGLFMYKKWGFYLFSVYMIYLFIDKIVHLDLMNLFIFLAVYGYLAWYKGFYKNLSSFN